MSVVIVGMKIAGSRVLGIYVCCKHDQSIDIGERLVIRVSNCSKWCTRATNCAFSVQHACGLLTTPTLLACADTTAHAQAQSWKGSSDHRIVLHAILRYSGYRACGVCALQSSSYYSHFFCF